MKVIKALVLEKYSNTDRYTLVDGDIFKDVTGGIGGEMGIIHNPVYCVTLYCELEETEDTQYPLEDVLDKYLVNCTEVMEDQIIDDKHIYIFEIEGEELDVIKEIADLIGKRVYNYNVGDYIELGIE